MCNVESQYPRVPYLLCLSQNSLRIGGWSLCRSIRGFPTYYVYPRIVLGQVDGPCVVVSADSLLTDCILGQSQNRWMVPVSQYPRIPYLLTVSILGQSQDRWMDPVSQYLQIPYLLTVSIQGQSQDRWMDPVQQYLRIPHLLCLSQDSLRIGGWSLCRSIRGFPTYCVYPRIVLEQVDGPCVIVSADSLLTDCLSQDCPRISGRTMCHSVCSFPTYCVYPRIVLGQVDGPNYAIEPADSLLTTQLYPSQDSVRMADVATLCVNFTDEIVLQWSPSNSDTQEGPSASGWIIKVYSFQGLIQRLQLV